MKTWGVPGHENRSGWKALGMNVDTPTGAAGNLPQSSAHNQDRDVPDNFTEDEGDPTSVISQECAAPTHPTYGGDA